MKCPRCETENAEDARFCIDCAAPMELLCPNCGVLTPAKGGICKECAYDLSKLAEAAPIDYSRPQSYTPKSLAEKILTTRSSEMKETPGATGWPERGRHWIDCNLCCIQHLVCDQCG